MIARLLAVATVLASAAAVSALPASPSRAADPVAAGHRTEVTALRTENRQVFQNADGTYTSDTTPTPRWVRRGNGWVDVDTTLRAGAGGRVTPKATPLDVSFSGGGDTALATLADHGRSLTMSWSAKLPAPVLDGSSARYPDVLPGVDLQVTASTTGFSEVLVVRTAAAARNPALAAVHFGVSGNGVALRGDGSGGASAVTGDGAEVFHSPAPELWDAAAGDAVHTFDAATAATGHPSTAGGIRRAMRTDVAADGLTVRPDPAVLAGGGVHFPLYLDPEWAGGKLALAYVDKGYSTQPYWNKGDGIASGTYNGGSNVKRTFFRMDTSNVASKHILKATFRIKETWSYSCTAARVDLWLTGGISSTTTWSKQPAFTQDLGNITIAKGWSSSCPAGDIEFAVTPTVTTLAAQSAANVTLAMRAYSETSDSGWKRWDPSPHLVIDYNTVPNLPTGMGTLPGTPCVSGTTDRPYVNTANPLLYANIYDPDGANGTVRAEFNMRHWDAASSTWQAFGSTLATDYVSTTTPTTLRVTSPSLRDGESYSWQVRAYDGIDGSAWSSWCEFRVDTSVPLQLPTVSSTDYPAGTTFADAHGSPGLPGAFTLSASNMTGITSFRYALNDVNVAHAASVDAPTGAATALISPPHDQQNTLFVWPVDQAGNVGPFYATYDFFVAFASDPTGYWKFDEGSGSSLGDTGGGHPLTTGGGTSWTAAGRSGAALHDDGSTGYATSAGPVVHTDRSLAVSAWVRINSTAHNSTFVSQAGTTTSGFVLYYSYGLNRWAFNMQETDGTNPVIDRVAADAAPSLNVWTHLLGVFDAPSHQLRLYVNGVLQSATGTHTALWDAAGALQLGRELYQSTQQNYLSGDVDEVRVYNRAVLDQPGCDPVELDNLPQCKDGIHGLATRPGTPQLAWTFDEGTGTSSADASGNGRTATLAGGATWDDDQQIGSALSLNGTTAYAASAGPALRTDGSYTVAAWVRLGAADSSTLPTANQTVIGQDSTSNSPFYLGYRMITENGVATPHWVFALTSADTTGAKTWWYASSDPAHAPQAGTWTHLVGVYDATSHETRLYVGGELVDRTVGVQAWNSTGRTTAGRSWWNGGATDFVSGAIDDVRAYTGTLTDGEIWTLSSR